MADENKNSSAAESILAETADLYKDDIDIVEEPIEAVKEEEKEEPKEEPKAEKKSEKKTDKKADKKTEKKPEKKVEKAEEPEVKEPEKKELPAVIEEPAPAVKAEEEAPAVPAKSEAVLAIEAKEAAKLQRKNEKEEIRAAKRNAKRARLQALIDQCPVEYKPVSTSKFFWYGVLCNLPFIGLIITILFSVFPINKNVKNFARAILICYCIGIIITLIFLIILFFLTPSDQKNDILNAFSKIAHSVH